jgi:hypothetical protein
VDEQLGKIILSPDVLYYVQYDAHYLLGSTSQGPVKLSKLKSYAETLGESVRFFSGIGAIFVAVVVSSRSFSFLQYLVIRHFYGHEAWANGLHFTSKWGDLSNGDVLSGWPCFTVFMGSFFLTVPCFLGSLYLFSYIGLRLRGRCLSDPKPKTQTKKKWRTIG